MKRGTLVIVLLLLFVNISRSQTADITNYGRIVIKHSPQTYDSLLSEFNEQNAKESYKRFYNEFINFELNDVDLSGALSDEIYEKRLKMMATEIQLPYNSIVKSYLNVYTRQSFIENILGRGQYFFPIFEEALYRHGLPMELKMLPVIESALIPKAKSTAAAMGLWQFMIGTGKSYGLEVNSFVDERCDPYRSTEAACRMLKDYYKMFGDWTLVIAAYNCGSGTVSRALSRVPNAATYWDLYDYLPRETRGYVPSFIAASYAYTYHKAHSLQPAMISHTLAVDTIKIDRMLHFDQISTTIGVPIEVIRELNPQYRLDIIPATARTYSLILPQKEISNFITHQGEIYAKDTLYLGKYLNVSNLGDGARTSEKRQVSSSSSKGSGSSSGKVTYKVRKGDTLGAIALRNKVTVKQIQSWNKLKSTALKIGQNIVIYKK